MPTPNATVQSGTLGPDGATWFIERAAAKVGRMTLERQFTEYPLTPGSFPNRIATGPEGGMWFSELLANKIGRITTDGTLTEYPMPGGPVGVTFGKDRQLYIDLFASPGVARMDLDGIETGRWAIRRPSDRFRSQPASGSTSGSPTPAAARSSSSRRTTRVAEEGALARASAVGNDAGALRGGLKRAFAASRRVLRAPSYTNRGLSEQDRKRQ